MLRKWYVFTVFAISISLISIPQVSAQVPSVPSWVNGVADFWIQGKITTQEFENCIEYLIKIKVAKEDPIGMLINEISELKQENVDLRAELRAQLWDSTTNPPPPIPQVKITLQTSQNSYEEGDTIVVTGNVESIILETPVSLHIFHEGNLVDIAQIEVAQDGNFAHTFVAKGPLWQKEGNYIVRAIYGTTTIETSFEFFSKPPSPETTDIFEVDAGSSGTFDVNYSIRGGSVKNMVIDSEEFALVIIVETDDDGSITIELPRESIDAKKRYDYDDTFIINIDGREVPYREVSTSVDSRTISIEFEEGDTDIKIIGTFVI